MRRPGIPTTAYGAPSAHSLQFVNFYRNGSEEPGVPIKDVLQDAGSIANGHELVLGDYRSLQLELDWPVQVYFTISCVNLTRAELARTVCKQIIPHLLRAAAEPIAKGRQSAQIYGLTLTSVIDFRSGSAHVVLTPARAPAPES